MKKLLKYLSPFAPDDSGAVSVLYELGGVVVICDAGGCAGNVCGFDEPRWLKRSCALFSAGLRDMDAILGRDKRLAEKLADACRQIGGEFTAIVGTPVPAVIATDYAALKKMCKNQTGLECLTIDTAGTKFYDVGESQAYLQLFKTFAKDKFEVKRGKIGVIGATPLEISRCAPYIITEPLKKEGWKEPVCFGMSSGLEEIKEVSQCEKIMVISPSGIKAAEFLKEKFGLEYFVDYPYIPENILRQTQQLKGKKVLVVHQQFAAEKVRRFLEQNGAAQVVCGGWFMMDKAYMRQQDFQIKSEEDFSERIAQEDFQVIIGDISLKRAAGDFKGMWIDYPHFAVSGRIEKER